MKEGSPPQPISFFINIPAAGKDPTSCQRARQQARFCDRQGDKTTKLMIYDLFADFYVKSSDSQPKYTVLMGSYFPKTLNEMEGIGFNETPDSTPGFLDYFMEADEDMLQRFTQEGYTSEMADILYSGEDFEKVLIRAMEVEVIDDDGNYPPRATMVGDVFVSFTTSEPMSPVWFEEQNPEHATGAGPFFQVPIRTVKRRLHATTLMEVMAKLNKMNKEKHWTFRQLRNFFAAGIDEAVSIISYEFRGQKDLDGNPAILHAMAVGMAGKNDKEKTVGFLHDLIEDCDWSIEDLRAEGFLDEVVDAVDILTHRKDEDSYDEYIDKIVHSGSRMAINVKINDLKHNIERGQKGRHKTLVKKHEDALAKIFAEIKH